MRSREGCCADWPKPCSYHEGWADALDGQVRPLDPDDFRCTNCRQTIQPGDTHSFQRAGVCLVTGSLRDELVQLRAEIERMTNHIHDLTGDGTGWWTCNSCDYRVSTNLDQRNAKLEAERNELRGQLASLSDKCVMYDIQLASLRKETGELLARANIAETKLRAAHVVIANLEARAKNVQGPFITREPGDTP